MKAGRLSDFINKKTLIIFFLQFFLITAFLGHRHWRNSDAECVRCHSDSKKMELLGYSQFVVTRAAAQEQSRHPNVKCHQCHLGNGRAKSADEAHKGMLKAMLIGYDYNVLDRKTTAPDSMMPRGDDKIREMLPVVTEDGETFTHPDVKNVLWHDRDPVTLGYDPKIAQKTCGTSNCHPEMVDQFSKTHMGGNMRQRSMKTWTGEFGPHNCGPSFADLPPVEIFKKTGFDFKNTSRIADNLNVPFTKEQAMAKQKACNVCHTGCLDCHYAPDKEKGVHHFVNKPPAQSCGGYGRGTNICHPGAMQSRRGETFIGGDYSLPTGMKPDVHYTKGVHCVECHMTGPKGMGDKQRKATCQDCHVEIEEAHKKSVHKNLDCAACHISELRGYQITIWGPGKVADQPNPFKKYSLYYGIQSPPILFKDQKGKWMPVKVWPHSVGNIKNEVKPSSGVMFRPTGGETRDAYYVMGTFDAKANNRHLLWLEMQQAAHPFGRPRDCSSCHASTLQKSMSRWEYMDDQGALEQFRGGYNIVADSKSLRIENLAADSRIVPADGYKLEDFASWLFFRDKWVVPGDFTIKADPIQYKKHSAYFEKTKRDISAIDKRTGRFSRKMAKDYAGAKGAALHNSMDADSLLKGFRK
ncbi:MAG: hypothetical protein RBT37_01845 [Dissulfurispiraceae bacterium]|jgi:hypothetical protein|nr:hypothetical protein [Dissulfurispiraceae bacterium]